MKTIITLILSITSLISTAQKWDWISTFGDGAVDTPISFGIDNAGNSYFLWNYHYESCGSCPRFSYILLRKINADRTIAWTDTLAVAAKHIIPDNKGNVYVVAATEILKLDANGNEVWRKTDSEAVYFNGTLHMSGDIILTGRHLTNPEANKTIMSRFDTNGNRVWVRKGDYFIADHVPHPITSDNEGNIYFAGGADKVNVWDTVLSLSKYDANGNVLFAKKILSRYVRHMAVDSDHSIYVSSTYNLIKFDANGNTLWVKNFLNYKSYEIPLLAVDSKNNLYLTTIYYKNIAVGNDFSLNCKYHQVLVAKYDSEGKNLWVLETKGDQGVAAPHSAFATTNDKLIIMGSYAAKKEFSPFSINSPAAMSDLFITQVSDENMVGVNEETFSRNSHISVYPNPSGNIFTLGYSNEKVGDKLQITIINVLGGTVYSETVNNFNGSFAKQINLEHLAKGTYFVSIKGDNMVQTKRIILQ